jgi:hypothetical protein
VVKPLPSKIKARSLTPSTAKKKKMLTIMSFDEITYLRFSINNEPSSAWYSAQLKIGHKFLSGPFQHHSSVMIENTIRLPTLLFVFDRSGMCAFLINTMAFSIAHI